MCEFVLWLFFGRKGTKFTHEVPGMYVYMYIYILYIYIRNVCVGSKEGNGKTHTNHHVDFKKKRNTLQSYAIRFLFEGLLVTQANQLGALFLWALDLRLWLYRLLFFKVFLCTLRPACLRCTSQLLDLL